jgi:two-component system, chemotaxis family, chemotaxis protein CheY
MAVRVLIADSSGITRDILRNHLECGGCQVVAETETVAQTIDLFRTTRPEVLTLDIRLRGTDGIDAPTLFRTIRRESPETSIAIVSASLSPDDQRVFLREGALECIVEPFDSFGLGRMWRKLSDIYPELKRGDDLGPGGRMSAPSVVQLRSAGRARN